MKKCLLLIVFSLSIFGCAGDSNTPDSGEGGSGGSAGTTGGMGGGGGTGGGAGAGGTVTDAGVPIEDAQVVDAALPAEPDEALPETYADALCGYLNRCELGALLEAVLNENCEDFIAAQFSELTIMRLADAIQDERIIFDPMASGDCLAAFATASCELGPDIFPQACAESFQGTVERDGACLIDEECVGSDVCEVREACPGTCVALRTAEEACDEELTCESGLSCTEGTCQPPGTEGNPCGGTAAPCALGLYCDGGLNNERGRCRVVNDELVPSGAQCDPQQGPYCEAGLSCALDRVDFSGPRFACFETVGLAEECRGGIPSQCADGHFCEGIDVSNPFNLILRGECVPLPTADAPCGDGPFFEICGPNLVCDSGVCSTRKRVDEPCRTEVACYSGVCIDGVCALPSECLDPDDMEPSTP